MMITQHSPENNTGIAPDGSIVNNGDAKITSEIKELKKMANSSMQLEVQFKYFKDFVVEKLNTLQVSVTGAWNDTRTLEQKVTDTNNNNTNLETRMKNLEETQNKTMTAKKDPTNINTTNQTSQRQMGEAITTLSERIAVLLSYTAEHSRYTENILYFLGDFIQRFNSTFKIWSPDHESNCFRKLTAISVK